MKSKEEANVERIVTATDKLENGMSSESWYASLLISLSLKFKLLKI